MDRLTVGREVLRTADLTARCAGRLAGRDTDRDTDREGLDTDRDGRDGARRPTEPTERLIPFGMIRLPLTLPGGVTQVRFHKVIQPAVQHGGHVAGFVIRPVILNHLIGVEHI